MDPNHDRSDCIESISLDLYRSGKPKSSKSIHAMEDQSVSFRIQVDVSNDQRSDTSRQETNEPGITSFEEITCEDGIITFHEHEIARIDMPHDDALVITLELASTIFSKILVDTGSDVNVVSQKTLQLIKQPTPAINHETTPLNSFEGKAIRSLGIVPLTTKTHYIELETGFTMVDNFMPFDAIVGGPWLHQMKAVPSVYHQCLKFLSPTGEKTIRGSQKQSRACYMTGF
ncbi:uncharacterized protein LOC106373414 [Brassica napus]|nr:uncharacterized protein LOC106373414 [Brassica napus]